MHPRSHALLLGCCKVLAQQSAKQQIKSIELVFSGSATLSATIQQQASCHDISLLVSAAEAMSASADGREALAGLDQTDISPWTAALKA